MAVNFTILRETVTFKGGSFDVRGLNTEDFVFLTTDYLEDMKAAVARHTGPSGRIKPERRAEIILDLASHFPALAAETISRCADAPERLADFKNLPVMVTIGALEKIFRLTVQDGGPELGKAAAGLASLLEANGLKMGPLATRLKAIIESAGSNAPTSSSTATSTPTDTPSAD